MPVLLRRGRLSILILSLSVSSSLEIGLVFLRQVVDIIEYPLLDVASLLG